MSCAPLSFHFDRQNLKGRCPLWSTSQDLFASAEGVWQPTMAGGLVDEFVGLESRHHEKG